MGCVVSIQFLILMLFCPCFLANGNLTNPLETYIVHVKPGTQSGDLETWYSSFLPTRAATSAVEQQRIVHIYRHAFSGFAAKLSAEDVEAMQQSPGFVWARPERVLPLLTTHTPNFMGLNVNSGYWNYSRYGEGVIIAILDGGITPGHPSFGDEGMPAPPRWWKASCKFVSASCNNKLIGARVFDPDYVTADDDDGHGTHVSSTAAGNFVDGANFNGNANGTASGIAPRAHVVMYKVCGESCLETSILAGIDAAIGDSVDIISISIGNDGSPIPFYQDVIAIGAFRAMQHGIFVSCAAGNSGPAQSTLSNQAPWLLTIGASTVDRTLSAVVVLGDNVPFIGQSAFQPGEISKFELHVAGSKSNDSNKESEFCDGFAYDVKGKIVACLKSDDITRTEQGQNVKDAGGVGMILMNDESLDDTTYAELNVLPAAHISHANGLKLKSYANSSSNPTASIVFNGTVIGDKHAPIVAAFSSRGPSLVTPGILKPDILGPGVNVLAAWFTSVDGNKNTTAPFNIISGTSMSTPHLSGVAALLKSSHPDWSPAAIKSAIMTTADEVNLAGKPILKENLRPATFFDTGSGHVNPSQANDPGLVYDIQTDDYIPYLCGLNYSNREVRAIVQRDVDCAEASSIPEAQLNYPGFAISFGSSPQSYTRTVTNVGRDNSWYEVEIVAADGADVKVEPAKLYFSKLNDKLSYNVTFTRAGKVETFYSQGLIRWISGKYSVKTPIAVKFQ